MLNTVVNFCRPNSSTIYRVAQENTTSQKLCGVTVMNATAINGVQVIGNLFKIDIIWYAFTSGYKFALTANFCATAVGKMRLGLDLCHSYSKLSTISADRQMH